MRLRAQLSLAVRYAALIFLLIAPLFVYASSPNSGDVLVLTGSYDGTRQHEYLFSVDPSSQARTFLVDFSTFTDPEIGANALPIRIAVGPDGTVWAIYRNLGISGSGGGLLRLNPDGTHKMVTVFGSSYFPSGVAVAPSGYVYVVTNSNTLAGLFRVDPSTGTPERLVLNNSSVDPDCNPNTTVCPPIQFQQAFGLTADATGNLLVGDVEAGVFTSTTVDCQQYADCGGIFRVVPGSEYVVTDPTSPYFGQTVVSATKTLLTDFDNPAQGPLGNDAGGSVALLTDGTILTTDSSRWLTYGQVNDPCLTFPQPTECNVYGVAYRVATNGTRTVLTAFGDTTQGQMAGVFSINLPVQVLVLKDGTILVGGCEGSGGAGTFNSICSVDSTTGSRTLWHDFGSAQVGGTTVQIGNIDSLALVPTLAKAATTTNLFSLLNPSFYGQSVTLTAQVSSTAGGTPTGTVTFSDGTTTLSTVALTAGSADLAVSTLTADTHSITATYGGDSSFSGSTSDAVDQVVNRAPTTIVVTSSLNPALPGNPVTFTATVTPQFSGVPTGNVSFYDNGNPLGNVALSGGAASLTLNTLVIGNHPITAVYDGDTNFIGSSTATPLNEAVGTLADLAITLAAAPTSLAVGANTTLTAIVTNNGPSNATGIFARLQLPAGLKFVSANPAAAYDPALGTWTVGDLLTGGSATLHVVATITTDSVDVTAKTVVADQADPNTANNFATVTLTAGIHVGVAGCTLRDAIIAANTDAPFGSCPAGQPGLDTIFLQPNSLIEYSDVYENPVSAIFGSVGPDALPAITSPITIEGRGSIVGRSAVAGTPPMRLFFVRIGGTLTLRDLTVRNGNVAVVPSFFVGGGVLLEGAGATLLVDSSRIVGNSANVFGGGIASGLYGSAGGDITIANSTLAGNNGGGSGGGAIASIAAKSLSLTNTTIGPATIAGVAYGANHSGVGGGLYAQQVTTVTISGGTIANNTALQDGGLALFGNGSVTLTNVIVSGNQGTGVAGAVGGIANSGKLTMIGVTLRGNHGDNYGGGIYNYAGATVDIRDSVIAANTTDGFAAGIGIDGAQATATVTNTTIGGATAADGNVSGQVGGGVFVANGALLTITGGIISANKSTKAFSTTGPGGGGGLANGSYNTAAGTVMLNNVSVLVNSAPVSDGGGILTFGALQITGGEVRGNTAVQGGGINSTGPAATIIVNSTTISDNTAYAGGGVSALFGASFTMTGGSILRNVATSSFSELGGGGGIENGFINSGPTGDRSTVSLTDVTVANNSAPNNGNGGGIFNLGTLSITRGEMSGNSAGASGGAIGSGLSGIAPGNVTLVDATISSNTAKSYGGAIFSRGTLNVTRGLIKANTATLNGGGIMLRGANSTTLTNAVLDGNSATNFGGNIFSEAATGATLTMTGGDISLGTAQRGAGIYTQTRTIIGGNAIIEANQATGTTTVSGGGMYIDNSAIVDISDSQLRSNETFGDNGGAITLAAGTLTIRRSSISGNSAGQGAIAVQNKSTLQLIESTMANNLAGGVSTIAASQGSTVFVINSTISTNFGVIAINVADAQTSLHVSSSTMANNNNTYGVSLTLAAIRVVSGASALIDNSIVVGNSQPGGVYADCIGAVTSLGHNLVGTGTGCPANGPGDLTVNSGAVFSTVLGPLASNGGPTLTHALLTGSPAIDHGSPVVGAASPSCLVQDQRGLLRPRDGDGDNIARCDIGAFEQQTPLLPPPAIAGISPSTASAGAPGFTLTVSGSAFVPGSVVNWNGAARPTTFVTGTTLRASIPSADLTTGTSQFAVALVTVTRPDGSTSNSAAFTIFGSNVSGGSSTVIQPGASSGLINSEPGTRASVGLVLSNNTATSSPVVLTAVDYTNNPVGSTIFDVDGYFIDVRATGADPSDVLYAGFYYPVNVTGVAEANLQLLYWNGTAWTPVLSSGGVPAVKDTTNNLDGTISGGRFAVTFDDTSTPKITELHGTVFMLAAGEAATQFDPNSRDLNVVGRFGEVASVDSTATTWGGDDEPGIHNVVPAELRTYTLNDVSGPVLLTMKVKKAGQEIKAHILSIQHGNQPAASLPTNLLAVQWSVSSGSQINQLEQRVSIGQGRDHREFSAKFNSVPNRTVIDITGIGGIKHLEQHGLTILKTVTDGGDLTVTYPK